jgi:tetratricopeptide (TPR) repeat protein
MEENNILSQEKETLIPESKKEESEDKLKDEYIKAQINLSKNLKKEGDEYLKSNQFPKAINKYTKAVITVKDLKKKKLLTRLKKRELEKEILIPSNLNMAYIDIKNKNWSEVIRHCGKVLYVDPDNIKARYRKCLALINQGELEKADEELIYLEDEIGGNPELEELEELYENSQRKAEGNDDEVLKKIGRKIKGNFMGPINQPEVKIDESDNKKNNEIIEKKKGGICFRIHMCLIYLFMKCFGSGKYEKKKKK